RASQADDDDAEWALKRTRAQARPREELAEHDQARIDTIVSMLECYLQYERAVERDVLVFFESRLRGENESFETGAATRAALDALPKRMREATSHEEMAEALEMAFDDAELYEF